MNLQRLRNVCNGGHIYDLNSSGYLTPVDLVKALRGETKAILIVGHSQSNANCLLDSLSRRKKGLRAKKLCKWSDTSSLWIVRND